MRQDHEGDPLMGKHGKRNLKRMRQSGMAGGFSVMHRMPKLAALQPTALLWKW